MSQIHCVREPSTINMTTDDPVIQEACRQSFHNHGQMVELLGKKYICMNYMGGGDDFVLREIFIARTAKPEVAQWNGEGLPPVGTVCELRTKNGGWGEAEIKYHGRAVCVWLWVRRDGNTEQVEHAECPDRMEFRPIRTPEQIAAEERENYCDEMLSIIKVSPWGMAAGPQEVIALLYDAGYRKFEIVDE